MTKNTLKPQPFWNSNLSETGQILKMFLKLINIKSWLAVRKENDLYFTVQFWYFLCGSFWSRFSFGECFLSVRSNMFSPALAGGNSRFSRTQFSFFKHQFFEVNHLGCKQDSQFLVKKVQNTEGLIGHTFSWLFFWLLFLWVLHRIKTARFHPLSTFSG